MTVARSGRPCCGTHDNFDNTRLQTNHEEADEAHVSVCWGNDPLLQEDYRHITPRRRGREESMDERDGHSGDDTVTGCRDGLAERFWAASNMCICIPLGG